MVSLSFVCAADDNSSEIGDDSDSGEIGDEDTTSDESLSIDFTYDNSDDDGNIESETNDDDDVLIDLEKHSTGNPIFVILIALMSVISLSFNGRK